MSSVTIITAAYNAEKTIAAAINSVLAVETFYETSPCRGASPEPVRRGSTEVGELATAGCLSLSKQRLRGSSRRA